MTNTIVRTTTYLLGFALLLTGAMTTHASEVIGTLSSVAPSTPQYDGSLNGTVTSDSSSSGGSSSGGSRNNRDKDSSNTPPGAVLGASTNNEVIPGFPNAGTHFDDTNSPNWWSSLFAFMRLLMTR